MTNPEPAPAVALSTEQLDTEQLEHLAFLARLELKPQEEEGVRRDLNELLSYFQELQAVETAGVEPMQRPLPPSEELRADVPGPTLPQAEVLGLAPAAASGFVQLPRTLDTD